MDSSDSQSESLERKDLHTIAAAGDSPIAESGGEEQATIMSTIENEYDCCICRLSSGSSSDRPLGAVTLLQSTSVLGHRESVQNKNFIRRLPLSDSTDYKQIQTDTSCWKQEEKRVNILRDLFDLVDFYIKALLVFTKLNSFYGLKSSCKYSISIGWKGGVYAQICGHYLHFDCYNSYKKTLDVFNNSDQVLLTERVNTNCGLSNWKGKFFQKQQC